jgi:hypothetical protein
LRRKVFSLPFQLGNFALGAEFMDAASGVDLVADLQYLAMLLLVPGMVSRVL